MARRAETRRAARSRSDESPAAKRATPYPARPSFDGETLNEAIAQVSQQTGWRLELEDPALREMRVGGYVHADPEAFIDLLSSSLGLEARREGDRRVVLSRRTLIAGLTQGGFVSRPSRDCLIPAAWLAVTHA